MAINFDVPHGGLDLNEKAFTIGNPLSVIKEKMIPKKVFVFTNFREMKIFKKHITSVPYFKKTRTHVFHKMHIEVTVYYFILRFLEPKEDDCTESCIEKHKELGFSSLIALGKNSYRCVDECPCCSQLYCVRHSYTYPPCKPDLCEFCGTDVCENTQHLHTRDVCAAVRTEKIKDGKYKYEFIDFFMNILRLTPYPYKKWENVPFNYCESNLAPTSVYSDDDEPPPVVVNDPFKDMVDELASILRSRKSFILENEDFHGILEKVRREKYPFFVNPSSQLTSFMRMTIPIFEDPMKEMDFSLLPDSLTIKFSEQFINVFLDALTPTPF